MPRSFISIFVFAFLLSSHNATASLSASYHYQPEIVHLDGVIETQTFPGLPNFESIKGGDEMERGRYLRLQAPIQVIATKETTDSNAETENNVKILHLTCNDEIWKQLRNGKKVRLTKEHSMLGKSQEGF